MPARPTSARTHIRTFALSRIVISVVRRCATSAGGWLIWTPMKMAPAAAAHRPAISVKRRVVVVLTSDSFLSVPGGVSGDVRTLEIDVVSAHHKVM